MQDFTGKVAVITGAEMGGSRPLGCVDLGARAFAGDLAATMGMVGGRSQLALLLEDAETYPAPAGADFLLGAGAVARLTGSLPFLRHHKLFTL